MRKQKRFPLQFLLLVFLGIGCSFLLSLFGHVSWSIFVCLSFMAFFGIRSYFNCAALAESEALVDHGEQLYLLGYLYTLAAILGVAMAGFADTQTLIKAGAVKLVTTVIGLGGMMIFKDIAHGWERSERAAKNANLASEAAAAVIPSLQKEVAENAKKVAEVLSQTSASLQNCLAKTQTDIPAFLVSFEQTTARLQTIESTLQRQAEGTQTIAETLARTNENLAPLSAAVEKFNGGVIKASDGLETFAAGSEYAQAALRSLETNIANSTQTLLLAVNKVDKGLTMASQHIPNSLSGLNELFAATKGLEPAFKSMSEQLQRLTNEVFRIFSDSLSAIAKNSESVAKRLPELHLALQEMHTEATKTTKHLNSFGSAVGDLATVPVVKLGEGLDLLQGTVQGFGDTERRVKEALQNNGEVITQTIVAFQNLLETVDNIEAELRQATGETRSRIEAGYQQIDGALQDGPLTLRELNSNIEKTNHVLVEIIANINGQKPSGFISKFLRRR